jgi:Protein of unknown function (DUF3800)
MEHEIASTSARNYARPSDGVRALVCGFASPTRQRRLLVMLRAFIDDSGSEPTGKIFVLAGLLSTAERWERFSNEWASICDQDPKTPDFHMSNAHSIKGGYWGEGTEDELRATRDARLLALAQTIRKHSIVRVASGMAWRAYEAAARGRVPHEIDNPYFFLFWRVIRAVARWQQKTGLREKVDFVFDDQGKIGLRAVGWYDHYLAVMNDDEKCIVASTPIFRHDNIVLPLKAADMCAWYYRRELIERWHHMRRGERYNRTEPTRVLWELEYAIENVTEADLREMISAAERDTV